MQYSSNYNLKLMEGTDNVKRQDFVDNFTTIDTKMKEIERKATYYGATSGTNTYTTSITGVTSYYDGLKVTVKIGTTSTGASTLNINSLGAKTILDSLGNTITSGGLKAGIPYTLVYNGTNFILQGKGGGGNVTADKILNGYTATVDTGQVTGTMPNIGAQTGSVNAGGSITISKGYHDGTGKITGNSLASQTSATATASQILAGYTAWVNGVLLNGGMANKDNATTSWCGFEQISLQPHPSDSTQGLVTLVPQYGSGLYGYYGANSKITGNIAGLNSGNIKAGVSVGRNNGDSTNMITGTFTSDANATADKILSGYSGYVNGNKVTGNMVNRGAPAVSLNAGGSYSLSAGYYSGGTITANSLTSQNAGHVKTGTFSLKNSTSSEVSINIETGFQPTNVVIFNTSSNYLYPSTPVYTYGSLINSATLNTDGKTEKDTGKIGVASNYFSFTIAKSGITTSTYYYMYIAIG